MGIISDLIFFIIILFLAYVLIKLAVNVVLILIILILFVYLYNLLFGSSPRGSEQFHNKLINPLYFSRPYLSSDITETILYDQTGNIPGYVTSYLNYWYIPMQDYFDKSVNGYVLTNHMLPVQTSEYCFHQKMKETGDFIRALNECDIPGKISGRNKKLYMS